MRKEDSQDEKKYYQFVRYAQAAVGIILAMGAFVLVLRVEGDQSHRDIVLGVMGLAVISGVMLDVKGVTKIFEMIIDAIPWTPDKK